MNIHIESRLAQRIQSQEEAHAAAMRLAAPFAENAVERDRQSRGRKSRCSTSRSAANLIGDITQNHYAGIKRQSFHAPEEQKEFFLGRAVATTAAAMPRRSRATSIRNSIRPVSP